MKLIKNAKVYTMAGTVYEKGAMAFDDKIRYVGEERYIPKMDYEEIIDAGGSYVLPGLIDAHCHVGMFEDGLGFEGDDGNEDTDPVMPQLRAIDAVNPFDRCFEDAYRAGVTTVLTGPGSANPVGGQFAAVKTRGICIDDMVIKAPAAIKIALGENPKSVYGDKEETPNTRMGIAAMIREVFAKAKEYERQLRLYEEDPAENDKPDFDMKLESLIPALRREIPVKVHAHRADDICTAIRLGREFGLWITIEHCTEGAKIIPILKRENMQVMLGPTFTDRSKPELREMTFATYKELSEAGVPVAIITDHPEIPIERLPLCAVFAVKYGMDEQKALEAITITAAKNCGIADRVGSLETGKDADICIFTELPTRFEAEVLSVFINGERAV